MLYWLYQWGLERDLPWQLFRYLTVRAAAAFMLALILGVVLGPLFIAWLKHRKIGQKIRGEGIPELYERHKEKAETPTMGGMLILFSFVAAVLVCGNLTHQTVWITLSAAIGFALIGVVDDWAKLSNGNHNGISAKTKLLAQFTVAALLAVWIYNLPEENFRFRTNLDESILFAPHSVTTPFMKWLIPMGMAYVVWVVLVMVFTSNAVNLTDGLDGLAIGCVLFVAASYALLVYVVGREDFATGYLWIIHVRGAGELAVCCAALVGAGLSFLWYNCHPAEVFMGDTGSLALGGTLATIAILLHQEILLLVIGGVFVAEAVSVMIQVSSFKLTGKRVFRMTPLHHHFEQVGWSESKIINRFWIVAALLAVMGLATLKTR